MPEDVDDGALGGTNRLLWAALSAFAAVASTLGLLLYAGVQSDLRSIRDQAEAHINTPGHHAMIASVESHRREVDGQFRSHEAIHLQLGSRIERLERLQDERLHREQKHETQVPSIFEDPGALLAYGGK